MKESEHRSAIVKNINDSHPDCHAVPIEAPETCPGFPDIDMCLRGVQLGVELKVVHGKGGSYKVQPAQIGYTKRRANALGIVLWCLIVEADEEVYFTLGCPHEDSGVYRWSEDTMQKWLDCKTGCVMFRGQVQDWAKVVYSAAQTLAP